VNRAENPFYWRPVSIDFTFHSMRLSGSLIYTRAGTGNSRSTDYRATEESVDRVWHWSGLSQTGGTAEHLSNIDRGL
jgi:hypothetical protein